MNDLPNYLIGMPQMYGLKQPSPEFYQGNDIIVVVQLTLDGEVITDVSNWDLEVSLKNELESNIVIWQGTLKDGIFPCTEHVDSFYFRIPHSISAYLVPGSYYYAIRGTQKPATGILFDRMSNLAQGMITVSLDASAPNPKLARVSELPRHVVTTIPTQPRNEIIQGTALIGV